MKVMAKKEVDVVADIRCDICDESTSKHGCHCPQFGTVQAQWSYGSHHDGEAFELHLCESCFFQALANLQEQRRGTLMFSERGYEPNPDFGRVQGDDQELV
ncbi:hypothetical protein CUC53_05110 [Aeromonas cavernicola]|uniref:Uncharacterized protein n=1 Tax=Aeromonas cavernicola TaxID=1006623 RepID=A0A2H9U6U5_9GAMM|nr:hypothetical protein CUC53_05110 [Aeromonas cavernicola]